MRVSGGADYITFVDELLRIGLKSRDRFRMPDYELLVFDSIIDMQREVRQRDAAFGLARSIAGYSWPWSSKEDKNAIDFTIEGIAFQWNKESRDWINSTPAENEIGSIHTTMGYDLNYAAVIFGPEISYNAAVHRIEIDRNHYHDKYGKQGIDDPEKLKGYILNIYKNMMYRGIRGTFVYACDPGLRDYFKQHIPAYVPPLRRLSREEAAGNNRAVPFVDIQVAAGPFSEARRATPDHYIELPEGLRAKEDYFVCKVVGESMNRAIPNGSYCLFRRYEAGSREGLIVLVQSTEIQDADFGSGYTVKEYHSVKTVTEDSWRHEAITLRPMSHDPGYDLIVLEASAVRDLKIIGTLQRVL